MIFIFANVEKKKAFRFLNGLRAGGALLVKGEAATLRHPHFLRPFGDKWLVNNLETEK